MWLCAGVDEQTNLQVVGQPYGPTPHPAWTWCTASFLALVLGVKDCGEA